MKKNKTSKIIFAAVLVLAGFSGFIALADPHTQCDSAKISVGTNSSFGKFYAYAKMTNANGVGFWIKPDTNIVVSSGTLTDISGFPAPYSSYAVVTPFGSITNLYASNSITFPATNTLTYQLTVFVTSPTPPPTNGQPMTLQIKWNP